MLQFAEPCWARVSEPARDMVRRLLDPDEARRMTAEQALCHPWPVRVCCVVFVPPTKTTLYHRFGETSWAQLAMGT